LRDPPPELRAIEAAVQALVMGDQTPRRLAAVNRMIKPSATMTSLERLQIYRDGYRERLVECLADDYPALQFALGSDAFADLCREYIAAHPSRSPSLNFFGRDVSRFCRTSKRWPLAAFAADLAALEWALVEVLHAGLVAPLSNDALSCLPGDQWSSACFLPSDAVRLVQAAYPVNAYFQSFRDDRSPDIPPPGSSATVVWRAGPTIWRKDLEAAEAAVLSRLFGGATIGQALAAIDRDSLVIPDAGSIAAWFRHWVSSGFFIALRNRTELSS
jgi:hypothetical protein